MRDTIPGGTAGLCCRRAASLATRVGRGGTPGPPGRLCHVPQLPRRQRAPLRIPLRRAAGAAADDPIRLVTFNIAHGQRIAEASQILAREPALRGADVIALQEMNGRGVEALAQALRMNAVYYPASLGPGDEGEMGNAVLSPWPIESSWKLLLPHLGRVKQRARAASAARVRIGERSVRDLLGAPRFSARHRRRSAPGAGRGVARRRGAARRAGAAGRRFQQRGGRRGVRGRGLCLADRASRPHRRAVLVRPRVRARPGAGGVAERAASRTRQRTPAITGPSGPRCVGPIRPAQTLGSAEGRTVTAIELTGHKVTREYVITREIRTRVGEAFHPDVLAADVQRLENLSVFAEIRVDAEPEGDGVRLRFRFKEMPSWCPPGLLLHRGGRLRGGPELSAVNLIGRDMSLSARAYFGSAQQYAVSYSWPWISGNHRSFDFYGARSAAAGHAERLRGDELRVHARGRAPTSASTAGSGQVLVLPDEERRRPASRLSPDNEDILPRLGASFGWDTRDSWRQPAAGLAERDRAVAHRRLPRRRRRLVVRRTSTCGAGCPPRAGRSSCSPGSCRSRAGRWARTSPSTWIYFMGGANSIRGLRSHATWEALSGKNQMLGHGRVLASP